MSVLVEAGDRRDKGTCFPAWCGGRMAMVLEMLAPLRPPGPTMQLVMDDPQPHLSLVPRLKTVDYDTL